MNGSVPLALWFKVGLYAPSDAGKASAAACLSCLYNLLAAFVNINPVYTFQILFWFV